MASRSWVLRKFSLNYTRKYFRKNLLFSNTQIANFKYCQTAHLCQNAPKADLSEAQQKSDEDTLEKNEEKDLNELKLRILKASLNFVPEHGWSQKAISLGAESEGLSPASHTLIEDGPADLVHYFNVTSNEKLEADLLTKHSSKDKSVQLSDYLTDALSTRLLMVVPYIQQWPQALSLMVPPKQLSIHSKNMLDLVDTVWYCYGDTALDVTWYSKRLSLCVAYKMSELSLMQDKSKDYSDTLDFLNRRIENVVNCNQFFKEVSDSSKNLPNAGISALIMVRNLFGANRWFR